MRVESCHRYRTLSANKGLPPNLEGKWHVRFRRTSLALSYGIFEFSAVFYFRPVQRKNDHSLAFFDRF